MSLFNLKNKSFLITGSSRGIGKSIALHAAKEGAKVIISSRKIDACNATADEINTLIGQEVAFPIAANIGDESQMHSLVDETNKLLRENRCFGLQCSYKSIYGIYDGYSIRFI